MSNDAGIVTTSEFFDYPYSVWTLAPRPIWSYPLNQCWMPSVTGLTRLPLPSTVLHESLGATTEEQKECTNSSKHMFAMKSALIWVWQFISIEGAIFLDSFSWNNTVNAVSYQLHCNAWNLLCISPCPDIDWLNDLCFWYLEQLHNHWFQKPRKINK